MNILRIGGGDEVIIPPWPELQPPRGRSEASERDGEVHKGLRLVTHCNYPRPGTSHPTGVKFILLHTVDNVLLRGGSTGFIHGADKVDLVVFCW